jgi:sRNA-binding regulator protein Hfq
VSIARDAHIQLVHKPAISAINPLTAIHLVNAMDEAAT